MVTLTVRIEYSVQPGQLSEIGMNVVLNTSLIPWQATGKGSWGDQNAAASRAATALSSRAILALSSYENLLWLNNWHGVLNPFIIRKWIAGFALNVMFASFEKSGKTAGATAMRILEYPST